MSDDVKVTISADDKPLKDAFDRATRHVDNFSRNASDAINRANGTFVSMSERLAGGFSPAIEEVNDKTIETTKSLSIFSQTAVGVAVGQFAFNALQSSIRFVKTAIEDSIGAFAEQEDAINKLKQSFILTGGASQSAVDGVGAFASSLEATSKFSDDAIIKQVAFIKSLGATTQASKDLVLAAANLSATIGGSLEENTDKLGKTLSGTAGRLSQYVPELDSLTKAQLKAGDAARIINEKFSGSAANDLKTYSGSIQALKNSFNNLQESIGEVIVKSDTFGSVSRFVKKAIDDTNATITLNNVLSGYTATGQAKASKTSEQLGNDFEILNTKTKALNERLAELQKGGDINIVSISSVKGELEKLDRVKAEIEQRMQYGSKSTQDPIADKPATQVRDRALVDSEIKLQSELAAIKAQFAQTQYDFEDQLFIAGQEQATIRNEVITQAIYDQKVREADAIYQGELLKNKSIEDEGNKRATNAIAFEKKEEALINASRAKRLADDKAARQGQLIVEQSYQNSRNTMIGQGFQLAATIAKDGSKEQFFIQKAAALAEVLIADGKARALIPAQTATIPYPANLVAIAQMNALVTGQTALGSAIIAASTIKGFATGGIVPGPSQYGDQTLIRVNPREAVLTQEQQSEFMNVVNGRGNRGGNDNLVSAVIEAIRNINLNVSIDGREIGRVVRELRSSGYAV